MTSPYPGNSLWPGDYSASTITGRYVGADGSTFAGRQLSISMPGYVIVPIDLTNVVPAAITVTLDETGFFRQAVPATDDPNIQPVNWTYAITEMWDGGRTFFMGAPEGQEVDVSSVAPVAQTLGTVTYIGAKGTTGDTGPVGMTFRNAWDSTVTYNVDDVVSWQGSTWIALLANVALQPDTHNVYWGIVAMAGLNGLPGTADLGVVTLSGAPSAGDSIIAVDSTHASWGPQSFPPGMVMPFAGPLAAVPAGWLPCDGSLLTRTSFPALFAAIGTLWGAGDGATTFGLPNLTNSFPFGAPVGQSGGSATHNHGVSQLSTDGHVHGLSGASFSAHVHGIPSLPMTSHTHDLGDDGWAEAFLSNTASPNFFTRRINLPGSVSWVANFQNGFAGGASAPAATARTTGTGLGGTTEGITAPVGTGGGATTPIGGPLVGSTDSANEGLTGFVDAGSNMPPYVGMTYLIKT